MLVENKNAPYASMVTSRYFEDDLYPVVARGSGLANIAFEQGILDQRSVSGETKVYAIDAKTGKVLPLTKREIVGAQRKGRRIDIEVKSNACAGLPDGYFSTKTTVLAGFGTGKQLEAMGITVCKTPKTLKTPKLLKKRILRMLGR